MLLVPKTSRTPVMSIPISPFVVSFLLLSCLFSISKTLFFFFRRLRDSIPQTSLASPTPYISSERISNFASFIHLSISISMPSSKSSFPCIYSLFTNGFRGQSKLLVNTTPTSVSCRSREEGYQKTRSDH